MLDHHDLLPEEQTYSHVVRELQAAYRMKPVEKQVLTHVQERLAQSSHALPQLEPVERADSTLPSTSFSQRPASSRQRWLSHFNAIAAVLFMTLLVGALALTFSAIHHGSVGFSATTPIRVLLVPAQKGTVPSQAKMEATRLLLAQRFSSFDLQGATVRLQTINGQPGIIAELPHFDGNERQIVSILVQTGVLAFWNTGPYGMLVAGASFNPDLYSQYNPGGKPSFTNQDLDATAFAIIHDPSTPTNIASINCLMKGDALNRFRLFTAHNIGNVLTLTLDGKVLASEVIANPVSGPFDFTVADFTQQQAGAIVSVLAHSPLPVSLKAVS